MTIQVELSPEVEARLTAEAVVRGMALEQYASKLLQEAAVPVATGTGILAPGDTEKMLRMLTQKSEKMPVLPIEVNERASYYEDRF